MGIVGDVIYYKMLDVDILNYATITDVLMTPISTLASDWRIPPLFALVLVGGYVLFFGMTNAVLWIQNRLAASKLMAVKEAPSWSGSNLNKALRVFPMLLFGLMIGYRAGVAIRTQEDLNGNTMKATHRIVFNDSSQKEVAVVGQNTGYIFYVLPNTNSVLITPLNGNIKSIQKLKKGIADAE